MTAVKQAVEDVVITSQALELLTSFQDDFDDLVADVAESCAKQRLAESGQATRMIEVTVDEVTVDDVLSAGKLIADSVKELVASGQVSASVAETLKSMNDCARATRF
jgi:hypothetical protein